MHYNEDDKGVYMTDEMKDAQLLSTIIRIQLYIWKILEGIKCLIIL